MTNTMIHKFTARAKTPLSSWDSNRELVWPTASPTELRVLFFALAAIPGLRRVEVTRHRPELVKTDDGVSEIESPWRAVYVFGTHTAVRRAQTVLAASPLISEDPNVDHDHASCVEAARLRGVPAWSAHNVERYLQQ